MTYHHRSTLAVAAAFLLSVTTIALAQEQGVKQVQELIKKASSQVDSIKAAKAQLQKTMDAYNALLAPDVKDRKDAFKTLQKEMANTEKKRAEVTARSTEMNADADKLFKAWEGSSAAISSPDLRQRSEERLKKTTDRFAELRQIGQKARDIYSPMMKTLQDQVTYLGHDLNPGAVASLKADADKLNAQAKELYAALDTVTDTATTNISRLSAE